ncbi:MAG: Xaa-Pro aminopeptidase [Pelagibacteraceae bacterium]|nr:Xaa-Pro aminopeptidase [Pelagibacteraceae bacterium]OUX38517.1 MAG: Xaa-Pro aminopeptidase [Candidatus Pelagibacter sp. TMED273]|tara:strand:- start:21509 stop:23227 length:1719 start_codon:yes stop_codon:yes gene_type:complete
MEKIKRLKQVFKRENIDGYLIPKNDEFFGEYVPNHNDRLDYISNFSGSYGFSLILRDRNYLFVDGRYILQAINQSGKNFKIINIPKKMPNNILKNKKLLIGFDPKLYTKKTLNTFFSKNNCKFKPLDNNLIDYIWKRKNEKNKNKFYSLPRHSVGNYYEYKINKIVSNLKKKGADFQFITSSENNAWLLNIRGKDSSYTPIPYSYVLINKNKNIKFFCDLKKISLSFKKKLKKIKFLNIESIDKNLLEIYKKKFIIDKNTCSYHFENIILKNNKILNFQDPIYNLKAIKNKKEIENIKRAHIYDGVALTKYIFWLKKNFNKKKITEMSASQKLFEFRKKNKKFKFSSFPTISGTGSNGAIIHYRATKKTNKKLKKGDVYLVDSGGQYEFGTTDVTRTISLNNSNIRIKNIYTRVLKGHIAVADFKLKESTSGSNIDKEARKYLKQIGLDYSHGTGHGVGYFLNVHEGPHAISKNNKIKFREGMVLSNEPGYYEKNKFGIRIENLIYVKKVKSKRYFENLTMAPIDKELINQTLLNKKEIEWINSYHKQVFINLKNFMNKEEVLELKKSCSSL